jgi:hypothetical protein
MLQSNYSSCSIYDFVVMSSTARSCISNATNFLVTPLSFVFQVSEFVNSFVNLVIQPNPASEVENR